jgi:hypothetical protein
MIPVLIQYVLLALGLMAALSLFLTLKHEIHWYSRKQRKRLEEIARYVHEVDQRRPEAILVPIAPRSGFNISRRVHAMRMLRRGEDTSHVAAALGMPCQEVELLIRVQAIVQTSIAAIEENSPQA